MKKVQITVEGSGKNNEYPYREHGEICVLSDDEAAKLAADGRCVILGNVKDAPKKSKKAAK